MASMGINVGDSAMNCGEKMEIVPCTLYSYRDCFTVSQDSWARRGNV